MKRTAHYFALAAILGFAGLALPSSASAATEMKLSDDAGHVVTVDVNGLVTIGGTCSVLTCVGVSSGLSAGSSVGYVGTVGGFTVTAYGQTKPVLSAPSLDLNVSATALSGGTLTVLWTDTDFSAMAPWASSDISSYNGGGTITRYGWADASNVPYGTAVQVEKLGPNADASGGNYPLAGPADPSLSMTAGVVFQMSAGASFSDDFGFFGSPADGPAPLTIACPAGSGVAGHAYSSSFAATGGGLPYLFSVVAGALPTGLSLNPTTGGLVGTPTASGTFGYSVQVADSAGSTPAVAACTTTINAPAMALGLACPSSIGQIGSSYSSQFTALGGTGSYSFSLASGTLPLGLTLTNSTGVIFGTPTTGGDATFVGQVIDTMNTTAAPVTANCVISIPLPTGSIGNWVWTDTNGNGVQDTGETGITGMTVTLTDAAGVIISTATTGTDGSYTFTGVPAGTYKVCTVPAVGLTETFDLDGVTSKNCAAVTLAAGQNRTDVDFGYVVTGSSSGLKVACPATSSATVYSPFSSLVVASGGTGPYTYSISVGSLPYMLSLSSSTGAITGTPIQAGTRNFTVKATDKTGATATAACGITVVAQLTAACPTATATVGTTYSSTVTTTGGVGPYTYGVAWGQLPAGLTLNTATGVISGKPTKAEHAAFKIKVTDSTGASVLTSCSGSCSNGTTVSHEIGDSEGKLPTLADYDVSGYKLHTFGFSDSGKPANLHGHNSSYTGVGVGIWGTTSNEIDTTHFVQVDISEFVRGGATAIHFAMNNVSWGESYDVYGSNKLGDKGTLLKGNCTDKQAYFAVPNYKDYKYISFKPHSGHMLLGSFSADFPCTCSIDVSAPSSGGWWGGGWGGGSTDTGDHNNYYQCQSDLGNNSGGWKDTKTTCWPQSNRKH